MAATDRVSSSSSSHTLTVGGDEGGGQGNWGVILGFRFQFAVIVGAGVAKKRWPLWESYRDKEQRGSPVVCPECIFPCCCHPCLG